MPALARGQASDCSNPELDLFTRVGGTLTDVAELEFTIHEKDNPVQVFPVAGRQAVNVGAVCPGGDKVDTGRYVAVYTVDVAQPLGTHEVRWYVKLTPTSSEVQFIEEFEVLAEVVGSSSSGYCNVSDLRDEGVPDTISDARIQTAITRASRLVDLYTGQWFEPRSLTLTLDGRSGPTMFLGVPIISVTTLTIDALELDAESYVVYNRHLTERLMNPDDRENPRIEMQQPREGTPYYRSTGGRRVFPRGERNVEVEGVFGYTEYDGGSPSGVTPELICHVTKMIAIRELPAMYSEADERDPRNATITKLKTRDQEINYADPSKLGRQGVGPFTGDPAIDTILMQFRRPIHIGSTGGRV